MVRVAALWLPILVSAVLVFLASSLVHMVLPHHRKDYRKVASEDEVMEALRRFGIPPGNYLFPHPGSAQGMKAPEYVEKRNRGPVGILTIMGKHSMGASLAQWFVFCLVVGGFAAYITGRALGPGAEYLEVFRFAGCTAFIGYSLALWQNSIWYKIAWTTTLKSNIDGLVYGLLTGGAFGWLWPS